jgi:uncharacterized membrane protein YozB (DUF420 family)
MNSYAQIFRDVGLVWAIVSIVLLMVAWHAARRGDVMRHRLLMLVSLAGSWLFVVGYLLRYRLPQTTPNIPAEYIPWIALHGTLGIVLIVGASCLVVARIRGQGNPGYVGHFNRHHRTYGRLLVPLWCFTHGGGIVNYLLFR